MADQYTITDVAARVSLDPDTLRYYERRGVLPAPLRDSRGRRRYREVDVHLIEVLIHLKNTGMPLARIAAFTRLVAADPDGVPERLAILRHHRATLVARLADWQASLDLIDRKITDYQDRISRRTTQ